MTTNAFHAGLTPIAIAREALMILENNLVWAGLVYRDHTTEFTGQKRGDTVYIRGPAAFTVDEFTSSISAQDITETNVPIVLEKHFDISVEITAKQRTLDLESYSEQVLEPQMVAMAQAIDNYMSTKTIELYNFYGTAGTPLAAWANVTALNRVAQERKIPFDGRSCIVNPETEAKLWEMSQFHAANIKGDGGTALERAQMGRVLGINWFMNQNVQAHTAGTWAGQSPLVDNAAGYAAGTTAIHIDACGNAGTLKAGDLLTFAGHSDMYRITADATASADAEGEVDVVIDPALTNAVVDDEAITEIASHDRNALFHRNCFALCVVPLELPSGAANAQYVQSRGLGLRLVSGYDMSAKKDIVSLDVLVGAKCIQPALGVRLLS
jgi:hypothetical protein